MEPANDEPPSKLQIVDFEAAYALATDTRKFELELFWRRSGFFWAFTAAAFAGFTVLAQEGSVGLSLVVACFGLFASTAWALVNLGSKFWYENWEIWSDKLSQECAGPLFAIKLRPKESSTGVALLFRNLVRGQSFSVSKITIIVSYYLVVVWTGAIVFQISSVFFAGNARDKLLEIGEAVLPAITIAFLLILWKFGRGRTEHSTVVDVDASMTIGQVLATAEKQASPDPTTEGS